MTKLFYILLLIFLLGSCNNEEKNKATLGQKSNKLLETKIDSSSNYKAELYKINKQKLENRKREFKSNILKGKWVLRVVTSMPPGKYSFNFPNDSLFEFRLNSKAPELSFINDSICVVDSKDSIKYVLEFPYFIFKNNIRSCYPIFGKSFEIRISNTKRLIINSQLYDRGRNEIGNITYNFYNEKDILN